MKMMMTLVFLFSTSAFANNSLEQFAGDYQLIKCQGRYADDSPEEDKLITITTGEDWVTVTGLSSDGTYFIGRIPSINKAEEKDSEKNEWACINYTSKRVFEGNEVSETTSFVSYPFCKGIPAVLGKVVYKITNLGDGKLSINKKHTFFENYTCYYQQK